MAHHIATTRLVEDPNERAITTLLGTDTNVYEVTLRHAQARGFGPPTVRARVTIVPTVRIGYRFVGKVRDGDTIGVAGMHKQGLASFRIEIKDRVLRLHYLPDGAL